MVPASTPERNSLDPGGRRTSRADRARSEPMAVVPLGGGRYDVVTEGNHVYTVALPEGRCTCPDYRHRGVRCKHLRRVAIDVTERRIPAPGRRVADCAACGETFFASEAAPDPVYCATCTLHPGEFALDRETDDLVVVVRTTTERAGAVPIVGTGYTVGDYPGNEAYDPDDAVVEVLYPLPDGIDPADIKPRHLHRYSFPRGRLRRAGDGEGWRSERQTTLDRHAPAGRLRN